MRFGQNCGNASDTTRLLSLYKHEFVVKIKNKDKNKRLKVQNNMFNNVTNCYINILQ